MLAIAACRAALGVLNLEFTGDRPWPALDVIEAHGRGPFGVLLDGDDDELLAAVLAGSSPSLEVVVLGGGGAAPVGCGSGWGWCTSGDGRRMSWRRASRRPWLARPPAPRP